MDFSMLFCIIFTMGAVFFDCKWEKVPNLWILTGWQISMTEHLCRQVAQGLGEAVFCFWGGSLLVLFLFFPLFLGKMIGTGDIKVLQCLAAYLVPERSLAVSWRHFCLERWNLYFFCSFAATGGSGSYIFFSMCSGHVRNDHFHHIWCREKDRKISILQYQF